jgi:uncharacterized repeat protein (TIGR01451 family)
MHRRRNVRPLGRLLLLVSVALGAVAALAPAAQAAAGLSVDKTASPAEGGVVTPGTTITYTVEIANAGPDPATSVTLTDATPAGTTYVTGSATIDDGTVIDPTTNPFDAGLSIADIPAAGLTTATFEVTVDAPADGRAVTNTASVSSPDDPASPVTGDAAHTVSSPTLAVTKTATPAENTEVKPGDTITYNVVLANTGTDAATGPTFTDATPANTTYVAGSATIDDGTVIDPATNPFEAGLSIADIPAGDSTTATFQVTVSSSVTDGTLISNTASVEATNHTPVSDEVSHTADVAAAAAPAPTQPTPEPRRGGGGGGGRRSGGGGGSTGGAGSSVGGAGTSGDGENLAFTGLETMPLTLLALSLLLAGWTLIMRGRSVERRAVTVWDETRVRASRLMTRDPSVGPWFFSARRR